MTKLRCFVCAVRRVRGDAWRDDIADGRRAGSPGVESMDKEEGIAPIRGLHGGPDLLTTIYWQEIPQREVAGSLAKHLLMRRWGALHNPCI